MKVRVGVACVLFAPAAAAEPCLKVQAPLEPAWSSAVRAAERELGGDCGKATLTVVPEHARVVVEIATADGRHGERVVERPRELVSTTLGLLASIPDEPPAEEAHELEAAETEAAPAPKPEPEPRAAAAAPVDRGAPAPSAAPDDIDRFASLGLTFGTRYGMPTRVLSTDIDLRGDVRVNQWIVSLSGRASPSGAHLGGHDDWEYTELSVGMAGGRAFHLGGGQLTVLFGPRLSTTTIETDDTSSRTRRDLLLQAGARYVTPIGGRLRPAIGFETEAAPLRLVSTTGEFPAWSTSLRFGIVGFGP
jgi:hypothetical protein